MTAGDSYYKKTIWFFSLVFPQLPWAYWQHDSFENEWFSNYLAFSDSTWRNSSECLRVTMDKKNGRATHHSPIRLNSETRRTTILRVTAGLFLFYFFIFIFCHWLTNRISISIESPPAVWNPEERRIASSSSKARLHECQLIKTPKPKKIQRVTFLFKQEYSFSLFVPHPHWLSIYQHQLTIFGMMKQIRH